MSRNYYRSGSNPVHNTAIWKGYLLSELTPHPFHPLNHKVLREPYTGIESESHSRLAQSLRLKEELPELKLFPSPRISHAALSAPAHRLPPVHEGTDRMACQR